MEKIQVASSMLCSIGNILLNSLQCELLVFPAVLNLQFNPGGSNYHDCTVTCIIGIRSLLTDLHLASADISSCQHHAHAKHVWWRLDTTGE